MKNRIILVKVFYSKFIINCFDLIAETNIIKKNLKCSHFIAGYPADTQIAINSMQTLDISSSPAGTPHVHTPMNNFQTGHHNEGMDLDPSFDQAAAAATSTAAASANNPSPINSETLNPNWFTSDL